MAGASTILFTTPVPAAFAVPDIDEASVSKASQVLQRNHENNHMYFNDSGFHNHIVHHICTVLALGASPAAIQARFDENNSYQRPRPPVDPEKLKDLSDSKVFIENTGQLKLYTSYLKLFTDEIEEKGWKNVVDEYVFKGDERANIIFHRLFAGFLHPIIHLGFGIEFEQPAIIAEGLAEACTSSTWLDPFFVQTDKLAKGGQAPRKAFVQILSEMRADKKLNTAVQWADDNKIRDGLMARALEETVRHSAGWQVEAGSLEEATAEMVDGCGTALRRNKLINFDFYYMHSLNSTIFLPVFLKQSWISLENKVKLVEWKGRLDLALYASRKSPELLLNEVTKYKPKKAPGTWETLFSRAQNFKDDGHSSKFIRALAHGEQYCKPYESKENFPIKGGMWLQLANMVMDSVEVTGANWIRSAGFDEAWEK